MSKVDRMYEIGEYSRKQKTHTMSLGLCLDHGMLRLEHMLRIYLTLPGEERNISLNSFHKHTFLLSDVEINFVVTTITGRDPDRYPDLHYYFGEPKKAYSPTGGEVDPNVYNFKVCLVAGTAHMYSMSSSAAPVQ